MGKDTERYEKIGKDRKRWKKIQKDGGCIEECRFFYDVGDCGIVSQACKGLLVDELY